MSTRIVRVWVIPAAVAASAGPSHLRPARAPAPRPRVSPGVGWGTPCPWDPRVNGAVGEHLARRVRSRLPVRRRPGECLWDRVGSLLPRSGWQGRPAAVPWSREEFTYPHRRAL